MSTDFTTTNQILHREMIEALNAIEALQNVDEPNLAEILTISRDIFNTIGEINSKIPPSNSLNQLQNVFSAIEFDKLYFASGTEGEESLKKISTYVNHLKALFQHTQPAIIWTFAQQNPTTMRNTIEFADALRKFLNSKSAD